MANDETQHQDFDIVWKDPADLIPHPRNSKAHTDQKIDEIRASIIRRGYTQPIVIGNQPEANTIIAGHARREASLREGLSRVPCVDKSHLSAPEQEMYVIADNKLAEGSPWDDDALVEHLNYIEREWENVDIDATGFDSSEIRQLRAEHARAALMQDGGQENEDESLLEPVEVWVKEGDIFELGPHRIVCGDSTNPAVVAECLNGETPHLMVTDPPYGVNYDPNQRARINPNMKKRSYMPASEDSNLDWSDAWALFPGDIAYVWHSDKQIMGIGQSLTDAGFDLRQQIIWAKNSVTLTRTHYKYQHEHCWYAVKNSAQWAGPSNETTLWKIDKVVSDTGHGAQKPVECMRRPILNNSQGGDLVYEPFLGSGTTLIAADQTDRICLGIELNPAYIQIVIERFLKLRDGEVAHVESGKEWSEIKDLRLAKNVKPAADGVV